MALITCPKCGKRFSEHALACPQCGATKQEIERLVEEQKAKEAEERAVLKKRSLIALGIVALFVILSFGGYVAYINLSPITATCRADLQSTLQSSFYIQKKYKVRIPSGVQEIKEDAFKGCESMIAITIPNSVTSIGNYAFKDCSGLATMTIGNSVTSIGDDAFYGCTGLTYVCISDISAWCNIKFANWRSNPIEYAKHLYVSNVEVTNLIIPNGVTSIESHAFRGCCSFTSVTIPNSVTSIGSAVFNSCSGLTSVTIPNSVTDIGYDAFYGCTGLTSVCISEISAWCNIDFFSLESNPIYHAKHLCVNDVEVTNLVIPDGITRIRPYAFAGCSGLTSVTIPNSVTSIGEEAFADCSNLTTISIPLSVRNIDKNAFRGCSSLPVVNNLRYADTYLVGIVDKATSTCVIRDNTKWIGNDAFRESNITSIRIPNSVIDIGENAFYKCTHLQSVSLPNGITSLELGVFGECHQLKSIYLPKSVTEIDNIAFMNCNSLESISIPEGVTRIGGGAFEGCSSLSSITIPNSVTDLGGHVFDKCEYLTIKIPERFRGDGYISKYNVIFY